MFVEVSVEKLALPIFPHSPQRTFNSPGPTCIVLDNIGSQIGY